MFQEINIVQLFRFRLNQLLQAEVHRTDYLHDSVGAFLAQQELAVDAGREEEYTVVWSPPIQSAVVCFAHTLLQTKMATAASPRPPLPCLASSRVFFRARVESE